jgi:hypothetical protein
MISFSNSWTFINNLKYVMIKYQDSLNVHNVLRLQIHIALLKTNKYIDTTFEICHRCNTFADPKPLLFQLPYET